MNGNNVLGIIFSNVHEEKLRELTEIRTMGSVPFGGRYRLIDFGLSNMVNSGINKVGVITKANYQSLMDHLGSGKAWDLSRKREGLFLLPPFSANSSQYSSNRVEALSSIRRFLQNSKEEYVALMDADFVCNIKFSDVMAAYLDKEADMTIVYRYGEVPSGLPAPLVCDVDPDGVIQDVLIDPKLQGACNYAIGLTILRRELLMELVDDCVSRNLYDFKRDFIQRNVRRFRVCGYPFTGYIRHLCSINEYFEASMSLMQPAVRAELFNAERPIYTKVRDDMPARYGLECSVQNSIVADGCVIEGEVENSILFRGVHVGRGSQIHNCVIMQDTKIGPNCQLNYVITDKDVVLKNDRSLQGYQSYPIFISKGSVV